MKTSENRNTTFIRENRKLSIVDVAQILGDTEMIGCITYRILRGEGKKIRMRRLLDDNFFGESKDCVRVYSPRKTDYHIGFYTL